MCVCVCIIDNDQMSHILTLMTPLAAQYRVPLK